MVPVRYRGTRTTPRAAQVSARARVAGLRGRAEAERIRAERILAPPCRCWPALNAYATATAVACISGAKRIYSAPHEQLRSSGIKTHMHIASRRQLFRGAIAAATVASARGSQQHFAYEQWDVFAERPLQGNPLGIFLDAGTLRVAEMQALARETYLTETTFVIRRDPQIERTRGILVKIFTPREELPFAGHPTLGTALALRATRNTREVALELRVGQIPVTFETAADGTLFAEMHQHDPIFGPTHDVGTVSRMLGLTPTDILTEPPIQTVSTGLPFVMVPVRSLNAIRQVQVDWTTATPFLEQIGKPTFLYLVTTETEDRAARLHVRAPDPSGDDPATGSAAGCAAAWMLRHGKLRSEERITIEQGSEVQRPSKLYARAAQHGKDIRQVRVGGHAVQVMRAQYNL